MWDKKGLCKGLGVKMIKVNCSISPNLYVQANLPSWIYLVCIFSTNIFWTVLSTFPNVFENYDLRKYLTFASFVSVFCTSDYSLVNLFFYSINN